jgi:hypothetical protein
MPTRLGANLMDIPASRFLLPIFAGLLVTVIADGPGRSERPLDFAGDYSRTIQPLVKQYCLDCHSTKLKKGSLDLERFASVDHVRKEIKPWLQLIEMLEAGEMPPKNKPQPTAEERQRLIAWVRGFLDAEARARAGDPGHVPVRRLSNAEYDCTIRDLTGVDLRPAREFPADGAAGEGFANAAEALTDISPALLTKYLKSAKEIAEHAVLLPDSFRFSAGKTRRDWSDESLARLRRFYGAAGFTGDGGLPLKLYLAATVKYREALSAGKMTLDEVATKEKLNRKYLGVLWQTLTDKTPSQPLDLLRERWRQASGKEVDALTNEITAQQKALWHFGRIGSYVTSPLATGLSGPNTQPILNLSRQTANDPEAVDARRLRLSVKPPPAQKEVVLYLVTRELAPAGKESHAVWHRPRFEGGGKPPLLLRDYSPAGPFLETEDGARFGIDRDQFGRAPNGKPAEEASLVVAADTVTEVRLPAALLRSREFVVEGKLDGPAGERIVQFQVLTAPPGPEKRWDGTGSLVASPGGMAYQQMLQGFADFRRCFPTFVCFPQVVPTDEVVCLKMFHREDEPLIRLFLEDAQRHRLDRLWEEHRFISQQAKAENNYLPQFIGFVTQDNPKELVVFFEGQREPFRKRAEELDKDLDAAVPKQLDALVDFAARAYRRPLTDKEKTDLPALYQALRAKGVSHDEAFRGVLTRVLVAPAFLMRIEQAPAGKQPGPVNDFELATRLSYFLGSSPPDDELRQLAAAGRLKDPKTLAEQTQRLLKDGRVRSLAVEFGTQWIHVRGFDELKEKNEKLFPTFDATLRQAIYEESILFFQDLFQSDRPVTQIVDADHTFLNETLAKHYAIPGVAGPQWRRVDGVRKYGRGGILGLASVQAKQSGASRTSPVLRGNWVVETLLGEKLPRPPADVPRLPEEEGADKLTTRQQVEKHASVQQCAVCHQRIDPFGFALERYDTIGRLREKDLGGLPVDCVARLKDGTELNGIDGLRTYLLTKKKDVVVRLFCRRLLGYALGRAVTLSDQTLIDEMVVELNKNDGRLSAAVLTIVRSPQFRMIRGSDYSD